MPPFFIPLISYCLWLAAIVLVLPVFRLNLLLFDQTTGALFFVSQLILVFAWPLSGPAVAAILSAGSALVALYLMLSTKEAAFFLQFAATAALFIFMAFFLYRLQQKAKDKQIEREKAVEDLHVTTEDIARKSSLREALQRKIDRFLDLQRFSEELKAARTPAQAGEKLLRESGAALGKADGLVLYLVNEGRQELDRLSSASDEADADPRSFDQWVMKRSQAIMIEDTLTDFRFAGDAQSAGGRIRSVCASPLVTENRVLGVIRAHSTKPRRFTADDLRLLDVFSSLGAVTLRNLLLYGEMRELATRDSLTGLMVNRFFGERLDEEVRRSQVSKQTFSVVLADIDHFKRYNDEYGHSAGDLVLKTAGAIFQRCVRPQDTAARYGGEEFALLLPGRRANEAAAVAETIRGEIEEHVFVLRRVERRVTASFGVASFPQDGRTRDELLWSCDKNLYEAKRKGRNRVCGGT